MATATTATTTTPATTMCPMCGFTNPQSASRCTSCGSSLQRYSAMYDESEVVSKHAHIGRFGWKWVWITFGIYLALQVFAFGILPLVIAQYDPQGLPGLLISVGIWCIGGFAVGFFSPKTTLIEPPLAALFATAPTVLYIMAITPEGFQPSMLAYIVSCALGIMTALFGALVGEHFSPRH